MNVATYYRHVVLMNAYNSVVVVVDNDDAMYESLLRNVLKT